MNPYEPVPITDLCNVPADVAGPETPNLLGAQDFRGLAFAVGDPARGTIAQFGPGGHSAPRTLPVGRAVRTLTFAHALLDTAIAHGGAPGGEVGSYTFVYENGTRIEVPLRDRFEIGWISRHFLMRPGEPYLAARAGDDGMQPRYAGPYDEKQRRISEVSSGTAPRLSFLWTWRNPHPDAEIGSIEISGGPLPWVLGGVSAGFVDEDPLERAPRRPVRIELTRPEDAEQPFDLDVQVDRGVATYAQPLPENPEAFVEAVDKGWGEPNNLTSSPAYTEISAVSSAEVRVTHGDEVLGTATVRRSANAGCGPSLAATCGSACPRPAATGCTRASSTPRLANRSRVASTSARPRAFPTSRTATTRTCFPASRPGAAISLATCAWIR